MDVSPMTGNAQRCAMSLEVVRHAVDALRAHGFRSCLTIASVVAGVAAVVAMLSLGHGVSRKVEAEIGRLGVGVLTVRVGQAARGGKGALVDAQPFEYADVEAIRKELRRVRSAVPLVSRKARLVSGRRNMVATLLGTESDYFIAKSWPIIEGRAFTPHEMYAGQAVCIVGATVRDQLFPGGPAIGALVRIGHIPCTVVGVLEARGQTGVEGGGDTLVAIPFDAYQRRVQGSPDIPTIVVDVFGGRASNADVSALETLMRERRRLDPFEVNDFSILDMRQIAEASAETARAMTSLLGAIAGVMLFVGGLGITNVMLVSVAERRREIAIRMSVGALPRQVLGQFLSEAIILATLGGALGALLGVGAAMVVSPMLDIPFAVEADVVWVSLLIAISIGVTFGFAPAWRASQLDPIAGLRQS
jgi:putative ABC transport system permease protein